MDSTSGPSPELRERAKTLYEEGFSTQRVADQMGISKSRARQLLLESGAAMRPVGRYRGRSESV